MSLGSYPKTDLKKARYLRSFAQNKLSNNIDPRLEKNEAYVNSITPEEHLSVSFIEFAENWLICKLRKLNAKPSKKKRTMVEEAQNYRSYVPLKAIFSALKDKSLKNVTRSDLLSILSKVEARGALSIAEKIRSWLDEIFRYAVITEELRINPTSDLDNAAILYRRNKRYPFIQVDELPELLGKLSNYKGSRVTVLGLKFLLLTGVRTVELRFSETWQVNLKNAIWHYFFDKYCCLFNK